MIPKTVEIWLRDQGYGEIVSVKAVGGGCINQGSVLKVSSGESFFLKINRQTPPDMFAREAEGLLALAVPGGPRVPRPYLHGEDFLLLEDLAPASRRPGYWKDFGRKLAALHGYTNDRFGFHHDNYIGSTPQPNPWCDDGYTFFAENRLGFQARLAEKRRLLSQRDARLVETLGERLSQLIPLQAASLIHGDLWSGNALADAQGEPAIIDPAAHYGWAEAELAMTTLFGSFPEEFYAAYEEVRNLQPGYRQRFPIYNLYHLLNHLNLFGSGYLGQVQSVIRRYI